MSQQPPAPRGDFVSGGYTPTAQPEPDDLPEIGGVTQGSLYRAADGSYWRAVRTPEAEGETSRWRYQRPIPVARYKSMQFACTAWNLPVLAAVVLAYWMYVTYFHDFIAAIILLAVFAIAALALLANVHRGMELREGAVPVDEAGDIVAASRSRSAARTLLTWRDSDV